MGDVSEGEWQFVSEEVRPDPDSIALGRMALGEPGLPCRFRWRDHIYTVAEVVASWKSTAREGGRPAGDAYVRRHWLDVRTTSGERMVLYCERQSRGARRSRWWLYRICRV